MRRDTDEDWRRIANEPYFGVFSHPEYFRENLTPERLDAFWASGQADIAWQLDLLRSHYGAFDPKSAIDFGCGVGRLTRAIAGVVDHVYGIDVAPGMLEEARRNAPANAEYRDSLPDGAVDWINSCIVFQHIHPANGIPLLRQLLDRLAPGGGLTIQITIYKDRSAVTMKGLGMDYIAWDGETLRPLIEAPPEAGAMSMYDYDLNQVVALLNAAGIERMTLQHSNHGGHHGVFIIGRKG